MIALDFSKFRAQREAHRAFQPGNTVTNAWGRGAGKSWFLRNVGWWEQVAKYDGRRKGGVRIVHVMPTLEQSRRVHAELVELELSGEWAFLGGKLNKQTWCIKFPGGSYVQWITAERAKFQRGLRADIVTSDEADDLDPELFDSIIKPFFSEPRSLKMMLLGGTPRRGRKGTLWRYFHVLPKIDPLHYFGVHATCWHAAAAGVVDLEYVLQVQKTTPEEIFKREWECDFDAAEGLVFGMFRENFHVRMPPEDVQWSEIIHGADHGYEDPGVIVTTGILGNGRDARGWVLDEVYEQHQEPEWWLDQVRERVEWYPSAKWYPDSAQPGICKSWKRAGARVQEVVKYAGSVKDGVDVMKRWLHVHKTPTGQEFAHLYVHPRCIHTIEEFGMYRRKRNTHNPDEVVEEIEDKNNHAMDALRYSLVGRFENASSLRNARFAQDRQ